MKFSDTTNRDAIIQKIEQATGTQSATTATYPLTVKTLDVNLALGRYMLLAIQACGRFQVDDTNQPDYPVLTTQINSGQFDYPYVYDGSAIPNKILDLRTIRLLDSNGVWHTLRSIDRDVDDINKYAGVTGIPECFDVDSNAVKLYPTPNYTLANALELYVSREPQYFVSTDTTKQAGIPTIFQDYLWKRPSAEYCTLKTLPQAVGLTNAVTLLETDIMAYYSRRDRVDKPRFTTSRKFNDSNR